jgi:hypothetical protein
LKQPLPNFWHSYSLIPCCSPASPLLLLLCCCGAFDLYSPCKGGGGPIIHAPHDFREIIFLLFSSLLTSVPTPAPPCSRNCMPPLTLQPHASCLPGSPGKKKHGAHFAVPSSCSSFPSSFAYPNYPPSLSSLFSLYLCLSFGGKGEREGEGGTSSMDELLSMDVLVASRCNRQTLGISPFNWGAGYYIFSQKSISKLLKWSAFWDFW